MNEMDDATLAATRSLYRTRLIIGVLGLLALAPFAIRDSGRALARMYNFPASWLPASMPVREDYDEFKRLFRGDDIMQLSWDGAVLGSPELDAAKAALSVYEVAADDRPAYLSNVMTGQEVMDRLMSAPTRFSLTNSQSRLSGSLVGPDGQQTLVLASYTNDGARYRRLTLELFRQCVADAVGRTPAEIYMVGSPVDGSIVDQEAFRSIQRFTLPSFVVGAVICVICLRSIVLSAAVLSVALIGQGGALAAVAWAELDMNAILIVLPPLVFVLTASAGIHLCNYYLDNLAGDAQRSPVIATQQAIRAGYVPCWLAASTTIVGLGSLGLVRLWPVSAFGIIAAVAVFVTLVLLLLILPGTMVFHGDRLRKRQSNGHRSALADWQARVRGRLGVVWELIVAKFLAYPVPVIAVFVVVTATCAAGLPRLETSVNLPRMFPPESRIRTDYEWFEKHVGPTINVEILLGFEPDVVPDGFDRFLIVAQIDQQVRQLKSVGGVLSARTFLPAPPSPRDNRSGASISRANIRAQAETPESALSESGFLAMTKSGEQVWRISFRFPFDESIDYRQAFADVRATIQPVIRELGGDEIRTVFTGGVPLTSTSQDVLLKDLFRSFLTAFIIVGLMMMVVLRSVTGGLLAMFPNLFPTITLFGFMGLIDMPLDIGSVMTASVALGIAVDGTVHLLSRYRNHLRDEGEQEAAVLAALRHCGPAMWQTTAVCAISPLVYGLSEFLPTQRFALMMLGLLVAALVGDLILLPALLASRAGRWLRPRE